jgi:hypothetical protein
LKAPVAELRRCRAAGMMAGWQSYAGISALQARTAVQRWRYMVILTKHWSMSTCARCTTEERLLSWAAPWRAQCTILQEREWHQQAKYMLLDWSCLSITGMASMTMCQSLHRDSSCCALTYAMLPHKPRCRRHCGAACRTTLSRVKLMSGAWYQVWHKQAASLHTLSSPSY